MVSNVLLYNANLLVGRLCYLCSGQLYKCHQRYNTTLDAASITIHPPSNSSLVKPPQSSEHMESEGESLVRKWRGSGVLPCPSQNYKGDDPSRLWGPDYPTVLAHMRNSCCETWLFTLLITTRYGLLPGATSISCGGLRPLSDAFFALHVSNIGWASSRAWFKQACKLDGVGPVDNRPSTD